MSNPTPPNLSPVRIYVLWHPGLDSRDEFKGRDLKTLDGKEAGNLDRGLKLARRIYHWFRMENMDGIPVYFRSAPAPGKAVVPPPIPHEDGVRNYVIPLIDANMVSSPEWRSYVKQFADRDDDLAAHGRKAGGPNTPEYRILPVALESVAYNMPDSMRKLNFIRHISRGDKPPEDMELLAKLTEVLCRDLRFWLQREGEKKKLSPGSITEAAAVPGKIKIFLSHAKADDTDEAVAIKEYIQRETQCEAFFDETDIASAYDYTKVLQGAISNESAGLVVIQGDNYADRPWCRKEIRDFLNPVPDPLAADTDRLQFFIPPAVVVQTMKGRQIGRTIPELGYSPCVRWPDDGEAARFVVTTLLREILFGLFYRTLADRIAELDVRGGAPSAGSRRSVYINRAPDPVMVNRILKQLDPKPGGRGGDDPEWEILHPGYGLSKMEKEGLEASARGISFSSFLARSAPGTVNDFSLAGRIIAISAGNSGDILSHGLGDEHVQELLVRVLRPVLARQASLLYGGTMPGQIKPATPWTEPVNYTGALLHLLITERETKNLDTPGLAPRLYLPRPWHERDAITVQDIAQWTDLCSFIPISAGESAKRSGIDPTTVPGKPKPLDDDDFEGLTDRERRDVKRDHRKKEDEHACRELALRALCVSAMRRKICDTDDPLKCELPDSPGDDDPTVREVKTLAHLLIGGKTQSFSGVMPGVFEEALCAFDAGKPLFLLIEGGGAAALLAKWLVTFPKPKPGSPPAEFTLDHYRKDRRYAGLLAGLRDESFASNKASPPGDLLAELWNHIARARSPESLATLLKNGLDGKENVTLLTSTSSLVTCELVWRGIKNLAAKPGKTPAR